MTTEQRAHDITMLYVRLFIDTALPSEDGEYHLDPYKKYCEIYPGVLEQVTKDFAEK